MLFNTNKARILLFSIYKQYKPARKNGICLLLNHFSLFLILILVKGNFLVVDLKISKTQKTKSHQAILPLNILFCFFVFFCFAFAILANYYLF